MSIPIDIKRRRSQEVSQTSSVHALDDKISNTHLTNEQKRILSKFVEDIEDTVLEHKDSGPGEAAASITFDDFGTEVCVKAMLSFTEGGFVFVRITSNQSSSYHNDRWSIAMGELLPERIVKYGSSYMFRTDGFPRRKRGTSNTKTEEIFQMDGDE